MSAPETFVVLCGMPRCGTRQFADFANAHPRLCVQGEIRGSLLPVIRATLEAGAAAYPTGYSAHQFRQKRAQGLADLLALLSKSQRIAKPGADGDSLIHGLKCPQIERQRGLLAAIVRPAFRRMVWLHCIRNPADCWLSLRAMPWFHDDLDQFVARYCTSLAQACALADSPATDPRFAQSVAALNLDAFIASPDRAGWLGRHLFAPLGLGPPAAELDRIVAATGNRNATSRATGTPRASRLDAADHAGFLRHAARLDEAIGAYNRRLGTTLALRLPVDTGVAA